MLLKYELLAMGSNDWDKPEVARDSLTKLIKNSFARDRIPVVIIPNKNNKKIEKVAEVVLETALELGAVHYTPESWAKDDLHPDTSVYKKLGILYDGCIVRGDSFGVGIASFQKNRNPLSWTKVGASSKTVLEQVRKKELLWETKAKTEPEKVPSFWETLLNAFRGWLQKK